EERREREPELFGEMHGGRQTWGVATTDPVESLSGQSGDSDLLRDAVRALVLHEGFVDIGAKPVLSVVCDADSLGGWDRHVSEGNESCMSRQAPPQRLSACRTAGNVSCMTHNRGPQNGRPTGHPR